MLGALSLMITRENLKTGDRVTLSSWTVTSIIHYFRFEICKKLGQGTYGKVQLGINKETGQRVSSMYLLFFLFCP